MEPLFIAVTNQLLFHHDVYPPTGPIVNMFLPMRSHFPEVTPSVRATSQSQAQGGLILKPRLLYFSFHF